MIVETPSGEMAILPGKKVTLALVDPGNPVGMAAEEGGSELVTDVALGVVGAAVIVGGIYGLHKLVESGSGDGGSASPSSP